MSTEALKISFFDVCTLDYRKLPARDESAEALDGKTDRFQIKGPDTDLRFSIKEFQPSSAVATHIPMAKWFSCPVKIRSMATSL